MALGGPRGSPSPPFVLRLEGLVAPGSPGSPKGSPSPFPSFCFRPQPMISKSSPQPGAELTDRTAAQRAAGHLQLTATRLAHPAGVSACSFLSRRQGFDRSRYSLASQDARLSPEQPGLKSRWRNIIATKARPNVSSTSECVSRVKVFPRSGMKLVALAPSGDGPRGVGVDYLSDCRRPSSAVSHRPVAR